MAAFRVFLIAVALAAPVWALNATTVSACTCGIQPLEDSVAQAELVVLGTVESVEAIDPPQGLPQELELPWFVATVLVEEYLKGSGSATLQHTFPGNIASCQSGNREGNRYLLAYVRQSDGTFGTSFCSGSLDLTAASEEAAARHVQEVRDLLREPIVTGFPDAGMGSVDSESSPAWLLAAAAAAAALAVSASAALLAVRRRSS